MPKVEIQTRVVDLLQLVGLARVRAQVSGAALRRPAAARGRGARAGAVARPPAARRAAVRARCPRARPPAHRDPPPAPAPQDHDHHGDARPGRGADDGRSHRRDEPGRHRADRHADRGLPEAGERVRRGLRRHDQFPARRRRRPGARALLRHRSRVRARRPARAGHDVTLAIRPEDVVVRNISTATPNAFPARSPRSSSWARSAASGSRSTAAVPRSSPISRSTSCAICRSTRARRC